MTAALSRWQYLQPRKTRKQVSGYLSLGEMIAETAKRVLTTPESVSVSTASERLTIETAGAWADFTNTTAPYMVEPMNITQSRDHEGCVFVGSKQCGKTASLVLNTAAYNIAITGMDTMIVCPSGGAAGDFAVRRVDRMIFHNDNLKAGLLEVRNADNQKRKQFKNGMMLTIGHPSKNELSGKPIGCVIETDYDRMEDDIDGEGSAWALGFNRTTTFGSYAMTVAESTPSRPVLNPRKILEHHEAPDCTGIIELYNRGDRRQWYWPCPHCDEYYSPKWDLLKWDEDAGTHEQQGATVLMMCPHCGAGAAPTQRHDMQQWGMWLRAGERVENGVRTGDGRVSSIASFMLDGTAAAFITWPQLVVKYLNAKKKHEDTLDESDLKTFWNTDLGRPYVPKSQETTRTPEVLMQRQEPLGDQAVVPAHVRALVTLIDVQKNYFQTLTCGISPGTPFDITVVDYSPIVKSTRVDDDGERYVVRPATFQEDWLQLVPAITRQFVTADGRRMEPKLTICDAGGHAEKFNVRAPGSGGVTEKAYQFYRDLAKRGLAGRFHLVRGANSRRGQRAWIDRPDGNSGKLGIARGDVPVLYLNSNEVKDILSERLDVLDEGKGLVRFPDWLDAAFFGELTAEVWTDKGWIRKARRNEAWDLLYYLVGASFSPLLPMERVTWDKPPNWLREWDDNPFVFWPDDGEDDEGAPVTPRPFGPKPRPKVDFKALGAALA